MNDRQIEELLDALTPRYDHRRGNWGRVSADARRGRRSAAWWSARAAVVAAAVAAAIGLVLAWPFEAEPPGLLERARAALGDGPILHAVLRGEWGGTLVDLETGTRSLVHGETEVWYDSDRNRVHLISRLGGVVQSEELYEPRDPPAELAALGRKYRQALEAGTARIAAEGTVDGEPVAWVTVHRELLPDVSDGKEHEWAQQVAVSKRTFEPVALRETRDGAPGPGTLRRVLSLELLPAGEGNFDRPTGRGLEGAFVREGRKRITVEQAAAVLGRTPLWLGRRHRGLPLAGVFTQTIAVGTRGEARVTGPEADAALECRERRGPEASACIRALGLGSISIRPDGVFREKGPVIWEDEQTAVVLFYGTVGDDPRTDHDDGVPRYDQPYATVTQTAQATPLRRGAGRYRPPAGSVFLAPGGRAGFLRLDGIQISIEAASEEEILAAARALEPMNA